MALQYSSFSSCDATCERENKTPHMVHDIGPLTPKPWKHKWPPPGQS